MLVSKLFLINTANNADKKQRVVCRIMERIVRIAALKAAFQMKPILQICELSTEPLTTQFSGSVAEGLGVGHG